MVLLDSCVLIWIAAGDHGRISANSRQVLMTHRWAVSALTAWEVAVKHAAGKLTLSSDPATWWSRAVAFHELIPLSFSPVTAMRAGVLPPIHFDPFDRGLVATALTENIAIVTPDERIHAYQSVGLQVIW